MSLWDLSPWGQLPYFQAVKETNFSTLTSATQITTPNNQRCGLIISNISSSVSMFLSLSPGMTVSNAIQVPGPVSTMIFTTSQHGILPTLAWFAICNANVHVVELLLIDWPKDGDNPLGAIDHPPVPFPTPPVIKAPGVNNDQGVLSYWRSLMQKIGGK